MWPSLRQRVTKIKMISVNVKKLVISAVFKKYNMIVYFNWDRRKQLCNSIYPFLVVTLFGMSLLLDHLAIKGSSENQKFFLYSCSRFVDHTDKVVLFKKVALFRFKNGKRKLMRPSLLRSTKWNASLILAVTLQSWLPCVGLYSGKPTFL